jgi:hypothetical protein
MAVESGAYKRSLKWHPARYMNWRLQFGLPIRQLRTLGDVLDWSEHLAAVGLINEELRS